MNPERFPGEPLIERLTVDERIEISLSNFRRYLARKRREKFDAIRKAPAKKYDLTGKRVA